MNERLTGIGIEGRIIDSREEVMRYYAHDWTYDPVVLDVGTYGISTRRCEWCGMRQESDCNTGR